MENRFMPMVPLVLFTATAIIAAGLMIGMSWMFLENIYLPGIERYFLFIAILTGIGILISLLHLGRKKKFLRAILGVRHSWLSREVIFAGVFTFFAGVTFILLNTGQERNIIYLCIAAGVISAIIMTWTIGMVYHLPGRFTWEEFPYSAAPLVTAFFLGFYWIIFFNKPGTWFELIFFILWLFDFLPALARALTFRRLTKNKYKFEFPHLIPLTGTGHMTRLILSLVLIPAFLLSVSRIILFIIMVSIILDRLCFYGGTVGISPKSEIAFQKAERMKIATKAPRHQDTPRDFIIKKTGNLVR